jgi:rhodanese-related sulfurtransferase
MKVAIAQFILILILAGIVGAAYNFALSSTSPEKHLAWVDKRYQGFDLLGSKPEGHAPKAVPDPVPPRAGVDPSTKAPPPKATGEETKPAPKVETVTEDESSALGSGAQAQGAAPAADGEFTLIGLAAATEAYREGTVFLDARRSRDYELGHIPGAKPMSAHEGDLLEKIAKLRDEEPLEAPLVIYCTNSKDCEDSKIVGRQLKEVGFLNISIYQGGFPEWDKEKRPVARGKEPGRREEG